MSNISKSILFIAFIALTTSQNTPPLDGSCVILVNKGNSRSLHYNLTTGIVSFGQITNSHDEVYCFELIKASDSSFNIYPLTGFSYNVEISPNVPPKHATRNIQKQEQIMIVKKVENSDKDYTIMGSFAGSYLAYDVKSDSISTINSYTGACSQKWNFIPVTVYDWNNTSVYIRNKNNNKLVSGNAANTPVQFSDNVNALSSFTIKSGFRKNSYVLSLDKLTTKLNLQSYQAKTNVITNTPADFSNSDNANAWGQNFAIINAKLGNSDDTNKNDFVILNSNGFAAQANNANLITAAIANDNNQVFNFFFSG